MYMIWTWFSTARSSHTYTVQHDHKQLYLTSWAPHLLHIYRHAACHIFIHFIYTVAHSMHIWITKWNCKRAAKVCNTNQQCAYRIDVHNVCVDGGWIVCILFGVPGEDVDHIVATTGDSIEYETLRWSWCVVRVDCGQYTRVGQQTGVVAGLQGGTGGWRCMRMWELAYMCTRGRATSFEPVLVLRYSWWSCFEFCPVLVRR